MEAGPGSLEIFDAPGNLKRAHTGRHHSGERWRQGQNRQSQRNVDVRFSFLPKEDIEISNASAGITLSLPESASFEIVADWPFPVILTASSKQIR